LLRGQCLTCHADHRPLCRVQHRVLALPLPALVLGQVPGQRVPRRAHRAPRALADAGALAQRVVVRRLHRGFFPVGCGGRRRGRRVEDGEQRGRGRENRSRGVGRREDLCDSLLRYGVKYSSAETEKHRGYTRHHDEWQVNEGQRSREHAKGTRGTRGALHRLNVHVLAFTLAFSRRGWGQEQRRDGKARLAFLFLKKSQ